MKRLRGGAALLLVLALAGQVGAQNGHVTFRGNVTVAEAHDIIPVCYGDYYITVAITEVLADPNAAIQGLESVQVCYAAAMDLTVGEHVEVNGLYYDGVCPKQYCKRVKIVADSDYITRIVACADDDWMVSGDLMYSIPSGNVGVGTHQPAAKLHILGDARIEVSVGPATSTVDAAKPALRVSKEGAGRQLAAYFSNPSDGDDVSVDVQLGGGKSLPWGWSLKGANGLLTIGNVAVLPPALNLTSTGYVGVGDTSPAYRLELPNTANASGQGRANAWKTYSSQRWKSNIRTIDHAMDKVRDLRGVSFDWKDQGRHDIGMIAEEVGKVVPEVVDYEANGADATALAYDRLVAVLVEALKEQDARIAELEQTVARNKRLEERLEALERSLQQRTSLPGQ